MTIQKHIRAYCNTTKMVLSCCEHKRKERLQTLLCLMLDVVSSCSAARKTHKQPTNPQKNYLAINILHTIRDNEKKR